jgi:hypothetical protein
VVCVDVGGRYDARLSALWSLLDAEPSPSPFFGLVMVSWSPAHVSRAFAIADYPDYVRFKFSSFRCNE